MSITGKLAVVTGGASGIGRAVCQTLARNGFKCVVADLNIDDAKKTSEALEKGKLMYKLARAQQSPNPFFAPY